MVKSLSVNKNLTIIRGVFINEQEHDNIKHRFRHFHISANYDETQHVRNNVHKSWRKSDSLYDT